MICQQILFCEKNNKTISICHLLNFSPPFSIDGQVHKGNKGAGVGVGGFQKNQYADQMNVIVIV